MFKRVLFLLLITVSSFSASSDGSEEWAQRITSSYAEEWQVESSIQSLNQTPLEAREWIEHMISHYMKPQSIGLPSFVLRLNRTPSEAREWVEHMISQETKSIDFSSVNLGSFVAYVSRIPSEAREWVKRIASCYGNACEGWKRPSAFYGLGQIPPEAREWVESMLQLQPIIISSIEIFSEFPSNIRQQACISFLREISNREDRGEPITLDYLTKTLSSIRDQLTQQVRIDPAVAARPVWPVLDINFSAALQVALEDGRLVPLYRGVQSCLQNTLRCRKITLVDAVADTRAWINQYADDAQKDLYTRVLTNGYGDGSDPSYNREITPLLRFVVPYMRTLPAAVQSAWLLPSLEEAATAYDLGDPISCAKGVQERLCVVGFDVEGVDPRLCSLSKFARTYLYVVDPLTNGADTWVKDSILHLTAEQRASFLGKTKPEEDVFKAMFIPALKRAFEASGLLPIHVEELFNNPRIKQRFNDSLDMHHGYDQHYAALQTKVRQVQELAAHPEPVLADRRLSRARLEEPTEK